MSSCLLLLGKNYATAPSVLYAYNLEAMDIHRTLEGYRYRIRAHLKRVRRFPFDVARTVVQTLAKGIVYRSLAAFNQEELLIRPGWQAADATLFDEFEGAKTQAQQARVALFGS